MLPSYFNGIFVHLRQKARLRPDSSSKFLSTLGPKPSRTRTWPEKPGPTYNSVGRYDNFCCGLPMVRWPDFDTCLRWCERVNSPAIDDHKTLKHLLQYRMQIVTFPNLLDWSGSFAVFTKSSKSLFRRKWLRYWTLGLKFKVVYFKLMHHETRACIWITCSITVSLCCWVILCQLAPAM